MPVQLVDKVRDELLPAVTAGVLRLSRHTGGRWTNETVDLEHGNLIVQISKDRGMFDVRFGSSLDPENSFSSEELLEYLRYEPRNLVGTNADATLRQLKEFLNSHFGQVVELFSKEAYPGTRSQLLQTRDAIYTRKFPSWKAPPWRRHT